VLFTASDFDTAVRWARESDYHKGGAETIESCENIEVQLEPDVRGYAPICYRVWVEGCKVGWPPTDLQKPQPGKPPPTGPLHAEARLAIPTYPLTDVHAPGDREKWQHRRDVPWPRVGGKTSE
jgi:hypothetical protein